MPSKLGEDVEKTLGSLAEIMNHAMARALTGKKHESGGIDSITISTGGGDKKKIKKTKPPKLHLIHPMVVPMRKTHKQEKGRSFPNGRQSWVIGGKVMTAQEVADVEKALTKEEPETTVAVRKGRDANVDVLPESEDIGAVEVRGADREGRDILSDLWSMGEEALDAAAEHALEAEDKDNGIEVKSSFTEQRGKKKKKKKAILKLLILGAVLKAKIGTLLQILSFKLQVKFFIVAVLGLAINLARLWIDIKNKHKEHPQKVIYYEHAQHQHHYDHEDEHESAGWGPWSRSMLPEEQTDVEVDVDFENSPYRAQQRNSPYFRPQQKNA